MELEILDGLSHCFSDRLRDVDGFSLLNDGLNFDFVLDWFPLGEFR
tara:strand:- start:275 stop:412 length:138 start_codon:yes stop_codon:yes gene_type:complete